MIHPELHRKPTPLDRALHGKTVLQLPVADWTPVAGKLNSTFLTAAEIPVAASEYPVVFIRSGQDADGQADYAPIAVLGLSAGENLYLDGGHWRSTHYLPALLATYPFCVGRVGEDQYAICLDASWSGIASEGEGHRIFDDKGEPTDFMKAMQADLERLESQVEQTRQIGRRLAGLDLLIEKRLDASMPDGRQLSVDGFMTVDEDKFKALPDETVLALHREGLLGLIHAHWVSMANMRRLLHWRIAREGQAGQAAKG